MEKNTWDAITAISTAAAAVFTAIMAVFTAVLAWFTRKAIIEGQGQRQEANKHFRKTRKQDQRHHEDGFRPVLVLTPVDIMDPLDRRNLITAQDNDLPLVVHGAVRNIGTGAALNIRLHVRSEGRTGFGVSRELTPMSAGSKLHNKHGRILIDVSPSESFNRQNLSNLPHGLWVVVLEYEDVFGNSFYTLHRKEHGQPWTSVGHGQPPDTTPQVLRRTEMLPPQRRNGSEALVPPL